MFSGGKKKGALGTEWVKPTKSSIFKRLFLKKGLAMFLVRRRQLNFLLDGQPGELFWVGRSAK